MYPVVTFFMSPVTNCPPRNVDQRLPGNPTACSLRCGMEKATTLEDLLRGSCGGK